MGRGTVLGGFSVSTTGEHEPAQWFTPGKAKDVPSVSGLVKESRKSTRRSQRSSTIAKRHCHVASDVDARSCMIEAFWSLVRR